jgi:hypothetical protein
MMVLSTPTSRDHLVGNLLLHIHRDLDRGRVGKLLSLTNVELLFQIRLRYGQSSVLDTAIDSLVSCVNTVLYGRTDGERPHSLYGRALQTLHQALGTSSTENLDDVWSAIAILTLFELISSSGPTSWTMHARGAARVLHCLGPGHIQTEAHKILLASQTPIMIIEALITTDPCFLHEPEWQAALQKSISYQEPFHFRSELAVTSFQIAGKIPILFNEVTNVVVGPDQRQTLRLQKELAGLKSRFGDWNDAWGKYLNHRCADAEMEAERIFYRASSYIHAAIINRLLLALDTSQFLELELLACEYADQAREMALLTGSIRLAYAHVVHAAINSTSNQWSETCLWSGNALIDQGTFLQWVKAMGRPITIPRSRGFLFAVP